MTTATERAIEAREKRTRDAYEKKHPDTDRTAPDPEPEKPAKATKATKS